MLFFNEIEYTKDIEIQLILCKHLFSFSNLVIGSHPLAQPNRNLINTFTFFSRGSSTSLSD